MSELTSVDPDVPQWVLAVLNAAGVTGPLLIVVVALFLLRDTKLLQYVEEKLISLWSFSARILRFSSKGLRRARLQNSVNRILENTAGRPGFDRRRIRVKWADVGSTSAIRAENTVIVVLQAESRRETNVLVSLRYFLANSYFVQLKAFLPAHQVAALEAMGGIDLLSRPVRRYWLDEFNRGIVKAKRLDPALAATFGKMSAARIGGYWEPMVIPELEKLQKVASSNPAIDDLQVELDKLLDYANDLSRRHLGQDIDMFFAGRVLNIFTLIVGKAQKVVDGPQIYVNYLERTFGGNGPESLYVIAPDYNQHIVRAVQRHLTARGYELAAETSNEISVSTKVGRIPVVATVVRLRRTDATPGLGWAPSIPALLPSEGGDGRAMWASVSDFSGDHGTVTLLDRPGVRAKLAARSIVNFDGQLAPGDLLLCDVVSTLPGAYRVSSAVQMRAPESDDNPVAVAPFSRLDDQAAAFSQLASESARAVRGYVKFYLPDERYGFIMPADSPSQTVYFRLRDCVNPPREISMSMPLIFDLRLGEEGNLRAASVSFLEVESSRFEGDELPGHFSFPVIPHVAFGPETQSVIANVKYYNSIEHFGFVVPHGGPAQSVYFQLKDCVNPPAEIAVSMPVVADVRLRPSGDAAAIAIAFLPAPASRYSGDPLPAKYTKSGFLTHAPPRSVGGLTSFSFGYVSHYNDKRGFGYVAAEGSPSTKYWFHVSEWTADKAPQEGARVQFLGHMSSSNRLQAREIELSESS